MFKSMEEVQKYGKDQMEAATAATANLTKGFQEIATEQSDYTKKAFENASSAFEQMIGAKSFDAAVQIQSDYSKKAFEGYVAQMTKMSEMYSKLAKEAFKPVEQAASKAQAAAK